MLFWGVGQGRDPLACTIQAPNLFLDSLPGHAPPSLRAQGLLGGSHGHSSQHCGTCSSCSTAALGITSPLLTMGSKTPHSAISPGPLSTSSPITTLFPSFQPHWLSSPSLAPCQLPPATGALCLLFLHSGKRLLQLSHAWASFPYQSGLTCHLFTEMWISPRPGLSTKLPRSPQSEGTGSLPGRMQLS